MAKFNKAWLGLVGSALVYAFWVGLEVKYLNDHQLPIFWLKELFAPTAFFTVLSVTFVEQLVMPGKGVPVVKKRRKKAL